ncbi:glycoside hydrolase family 2 protein [Rheinheimera maricola]|uniref:Glycoside hydrolase family 2 protein n=1 Tax=Rheinheimera maricola TaxID=2793282 RepID=A0ABS7XH29_9GAMM|nr:glycoside hydrolase family 2 TIM barrel-domain containing protein [Rheinheimera maricola]MBZ9613847.1 glycoside hydrolase family 2 protein [Rheinheimera maricola]
MVIARNSDTQLLLQGISGRIIYAFLMLLLAFMSTASVQAHANDAHMKLRQTQLFNKNWQYLQHHTTDVNVALAQKNWQTVELPHSWNTTDSVDPLPGYRRSASWYRTSLTPTTKQRRILHFEGANMRSSVYVNGHLAGEHVGGYLGFDIELTPLLLQENVNEILVRVDNSYDPNLIPSQKADFVLFGGITRDVWLKTLPDTFLQQLEVSTSQVQTGKPSTEFSVTINSANPEPRTLILKSKILAPDNTEVALNQQSIEFESQLQTIQIKMPNIVNPELWSVDNPKLYRLQAAIYDIEGNLLDQIDDRFGYRWFEMRPHQGFFLNGKKLLIRGTHRHEEIAGKGSALSNEQHRADMQQIKAMGANFVRLAHYPQDPEVYRAADELGLILWDELPWVRGGKGGTDWEYNTERYLKQQIKQNYNHPSIAFWSLGNEMDWEEDFPGGGAPEVVTPYLQKLNTLVKTLDKSRLTTLRKYPPGADIVDAYSPSIWMGWYGGAYGQYGDALAATMKQYPHFVHMEYGGSSHVGRHTESPIGPNGFNEIRVSAQDAMNQAGTTSIANASDWSESYIVDLFDWHLRLSESTPGFAGNAQWAFRDFATPLRPENPIPYVNQKGLLTRDGKPKDAYYVFASYWSDTPFCYIMSKTWTKRQGSENGRPVRVYCNTNTAELFLNGQSLGVKKRDVTLFPAAGLVWQVPFVKGTNKLKVIGKIDNLLVEDSLQVDYQPTPHGKLKRVELTYSNLEDGSLLIAAEALDEDGLRVLNFNERAFFSNLTESGFFSTHQGTPTGTDNIQFSSGYASIVFYPGDTPTVLEFISQSVKGVYLKVAAQHEN